MTATIAPRPSVADLHRDHYCSLVRLARRLLDDEAPAEEVVQDAFLTMHEGRAHPEAGKEPAYLRSMVMNAARSRLRHRQVVDRHRHDQPRIEAAAEESALGRVERDELMAALSELPERQCQVLTLRYYRDLSEAQIALTLGISRGSVKTHASRGLRTLAGRMAEAA